MTRDQAHALAAAAALTVAAAAAWALARGGAVTASARVDAAADAGGWDDAGYRADKAHLWQPCTDDVAVGQLHRGHHLFTRPGRLGGQRAALVAAGGWRWFADPPGAAVL